jgi:DTW domain-containing protein
MREMRPTCFRCHRSLRACFCARVRAARAGFDLVLLAHPKEARNRVGTLRIAQLGVEGARLFIGTGRELDGNAELRALLAEEGRFPAVLFPSAGSRDLGAPGWFPRGRRLTLLVIDGTWHQARRMVRASALLSALPHLSFRPAAPSGYRIREQPGETCLSTVEAVHSVIDLLGSAGLIPAPAGREHDRMLEIFRQMVEFQLRCESDIAFVSAPVG